MEGRILHRCSLIPNGCFQWQYHLLWGFRTPHHVYSIIVRCVKNINRCINCQRHTHVEQYFKWKYNHHWINHHISWITSSHAASHRPISRFNLFNTNTQTNKHMDIWKQREVVREREGEISFLAYFHFVWLNFLSLIRLTNR